MPRHKQSLTARQQHVLELVAQGLSGKEIALVLGISETGVKKHLEVLRRRYGVSNRIQLLRRAIELGDIDEIRRRQQ